MEDIETSAKSLLYFALNDVTFKDFVVNNVKCIGYDTSFLIYETDEVEIPKKLNFYNAKIQNSNSNGPLIKLSGDKIDLTLNGSSFYKVSSFGSIIKNTSLKVFILFICKILKKYIYKYYILKY